MEPTYIHAESTVSPPEIEVGVTTVYLRRNVVETQREEMDGRKTTVYIYEEAQLTKDEALFMLANRQGGLSKAVEDADDMNIDQEYRLLMLELGMTNNET